MPKELHAVIYDGSCGFCVGNLKWLGFLDRLHLFQSVPYQAADLHVRFPSLRQAECEKSMHLVLSDGRVFSGADAFREIFLRTPLLFWLGYLMRMPPLPWASKRLYAVLARNRYRLGKACKWHGPLALFILALSALTHSRSAQSSPGPIVKGKDFQTLATQQIRFVSLKKSDQALFADQNLLRRVDLKGDQTAVRNQGRRDACTYFVTTALVESFIKKSTGKELDLSEEYLAWAAKTKKKMRSAEEGSSVAVNAAALQDFGWMREEDFPYQPSWFEPGFPCAGQKEKTVVKSLCYSHYGPDEEKSKLIVKESHLVFAVLGSRSIDIVRSLSRTSSPVAFSLLGHPEMWALTRSTGNLYLTRQWKQACTRAPKLCGGHVVLVVGYDLEKKNFTFKNSWGKEWGREGYGTIPFDYVDQMSDRKLLTVRSASN